MQATQEAPARKARVIRKPAAKAAPVKPAVKAKPAKASAKPAVKARPAKPSVPLHNIATTWTGASSVVNARPTKTPIDYSRFGTMTDMAMSDRDIKSLSDLRKTFEKRAFQRANIDAGILRRLGERGYIEHVNGSAVDPLATFKLTSRAFKPQ
jgi:hypothetical protein